MIYVSKGSHHYEFYHVWDKRKMADTLKTDSVICFPLSVFVCHGHVQHAGAAENLGSFKLHCRVY